MTRQDRTEYECGALRNSAAAESLDVNRRDEEKCDKKSQSDSLTRHDAPCFFSETTL